MGAATGLLTQYLFSVGLWLLMRTDSGDVLAQVTDVSAIPSSSTSSQTCLRPPNSSVVATGTDLWCYQCKESYIKTYDPLNAPCRFNLSQVIVRQCGPGDRYCKIERLELHRQVLSLERTCTSQCLFGCRFNGYGLTYMKCTSCCQTYGCNSGNGASDVSLQIEALALGLVVQCLRQFTG